MTKPIGAICNIDCKYCFYLEKEKLYGDKKNAAEFRMNDATLETYVRQYIEQQNVPEINFAWQGGEPTLMGLAFFERVVALQKKYANGKKISNAFQTNGMLIDDAWCEFLKREGFLVGLSLDGPQEIHDLYRVTRAGKPTWPQVMNALTLLKKHRVEFNTLTVVHKEMAYKPLEVYQFLREHGSGYVQFIPLVERIGGGGGEQRDAHDLAEPPLLKIWTPYAAVTSWSVEPQQYGEFLCKIFDEWVRRDVGKVYVQIFDVMLGIWAGYGSSLCFFSETCGKALAMEHNGDLYSCDHFVYDKYKLGNINEKSIQELVEGSQQTQFGNDKRDALPKYCQRCEVRFACNGECPKHRFTTTPEGEPGLNYLCPAYKRFLPHIDPYMKTMARLLHSGRAPAEIMQMLAERDAQTKTPAPSLVRPVATMPGRNDPCPCGSGKKFKKCCGA